MPVSQRASPAQTRANEVLLGRPAPPRHSGRGVVGGGPRPGPSTTGGEDGVLDHVLAIWMRLPHVSSRTAVVTGPIVRGSWVNVTPRPRSRSYSALTSSTANEVNGIPSATRAALNGFTAGCSSGSRTSSTPSGASGEVTVSQRWAPSGTSVFFTKPSTSV